MSTGTGIVGKYPASIFEGSSEEGFKVTDNARRIDGEGDSSHVDTDASTDVGSRGDNGLVNGLYHGSESFVGCLLSGISSLLGGQDGHIVISFTTSSVYIIYIRPRDNHEGTARSIIAAVAILTTHFTLCYNCVYIPSLLQPRQVSI